MKLNFKVFRWMSGRSVALGGVIFTAVLLYPSIQRVSVKGDLARLDQALVERKLSSELNRPMILVSLSKIRTALKSIDGVSDAQVLRRWPGDVHIHVVFRQPVLRWNEPGFIDRSGALFYWPKAGADHQSLPQLKTSLDLIQPGLSYFNRLQHDLNPVLKRRIQSLAYIPWIGWQVDLGRNCLIILGEQDIMRRWKRFMNVAPQVISVGKRCHRVDLRYLNGFSVK